MSMIPPERLARERMVSADAVRDGRIDLRVYPYRHLVVTARRGWGHSGFQPLLEAVEHLSNYGWELVNISSIGDGHELYAVIRRTA
ncbi:hypothetical protein [Micromonospora sp. HK10]|uniref:hypothetical protein n=1 Tax=Micromonospora sp. HK10 TaxID=1538294 RepID=UPI0006272EAD|nr:hypothetical protein [Micromonospora sp. HK10]KKK05067.1 hypothetical protein LQ51_16000 [Micromonospora sp. HK10]